MCAGVATDRPENWKRPEDLDPTEQSRLCGECDRYYVIDFATVVREQSGCPCKGGESSHLIGCELTEDRHEFETVATKRGTAHRCSFCQRFRSEVMKERAEKALDLTRGRSAHNSVRLLAIVVVWLVERTLTDDH